MCSFYNFYSFYVLHITMVSFFSTCSDTCPTPSFPHPRTLFPLCVPYIPPILFTDTLLLPKPVESRSRSHSSSPDSTNSTDLRRSRGIINGTVRYSDGTVIPKGTVLICYVPCRYSLVSIIYMHRARRIFYILPRSIY